MGIPVVTDHDEFTTYLRDADILLFDKLSSLNRLVQWADNRPVGHCAIWHSGGGLFEATRKPDKHGGSHSGVFDTPLSTLLAERINDGRGGSVGLVRTVTAVRYRGITDAQRQQVLDYAKEACGKEEFAVPEMVCLAPYAVRRSYAGESRPANEVMAGLMKVFQFYANASRPPVPQAQRMFCSQLVYRSYQAAGMTITIVDPLHASYVKPLPRRASSDSPSTAYRTRSFGMGVPPLPTTTEPDLSQDDRELADYSRVFEDVVLGPPTALDGPASVDHSRDGTSRTLGDALRGRHPQLEDMITPGDYWSSPSLEPIAALHRPPFSEG